MLVPEGTALPGPAARASVAAQPYNLPAEVDLVMKGHEDGGSMFFGMEEALPSTRHPRRTERYEAEGAFRRYP